MRRAMKRALAGLAAVSAVAAGLLLDSGAGAPASAKVPGSGFRVIAATAPDYPEHVDWVTVCKPVKAAMDDPIVFPGKPGASHMHTFSGNLGVTAFSYASQLLGAPTNCTNSGDHASYWMPTLYVKGKAVAPYVTRIYYRAGTFTGASIRSIPFGLRMLAGNAMAVTPQKSNIAGWHCRLEGQGAVTGKSAVPPQCPGQSLLEASVVFPNCWDGKNLDSVDHRSHMAYAVKYHCDAAHPVQIPQVTIAERFTPGTTYGTLTLASMNSPLTLHADFLDAWKQSDMDLLVARCIHASVACEDVSDRRMPPAPKA
jgi:hypothetical protein